MTMTRKGFLVGAATAALAGGHAAAGEIVGVPGPAGDLKVRFLGTGAADWSRSTGPKDGEWRRRSSVLLDDRILIDFTDYSLDMLGAAKPEVIFYTHQHADHYQPSAAVKAGVKRAYVHTSWYDHAKAEFAAEAKRPDGHAVEVVPVRFFETVSFDGYAFTLLPANHNCDRPEWEAGVWTVRKGVTHLYYATDTAYCDARTWSFYIARQPPLTAVIHEATLAKRDTRIAGHSTTDMAKYFADAVLYRKYYTPPPGRKVYLTHLSRDAQPSRKELDAHLPPPLAAAYDGLEVVF